MKIRSWQTENAIRRDNHGKPDPEREEQEKARALLRGTIYALQCQWANEDAVKQATRTTEKTNMINDQKSKLLKLAYRAIRKNYFGDFTKFPEALAKVVGKHPAEFSNCRDAALAEFNNEAGSLPPPLVLKSEVAALQRASGLSYDESFSAVMTRYPAAQRRIQLQNEEQEDELLDSKKAGQEFQDALDAYFLAHPGMVREKPVDYNGAYKRVCELNPAIVARMHKPGRGAANLWLPGASDAKTPPARAARIRKAAHA